MKRDLHLIAVILQLVANNQADELPTEFCNNALDKYNQDQVHDLVKILEANNFLYKIAPQHDFEGLNNFHITWKGQCFLELFHRFEEIPKDDPMRLVAEVALLGFY